MIKAPTPEQLYAAVKKPKGVYINPFRFPTAQEDAQSVRALRLELIRSVP